MNIDPIELIERSSDVWESCVSAGIEAKEMLDEGRWTIGDLACLIVKQYNANMVGNFAKAIKYEAARVKQYRTVSRFWEKSTRVDFLETCPQLTYTHYREAMRLKNLKDAQAFLRQCADNDWTVERTRIEIDKRLGKPTPPMRLLEGDEVCIVGIDKNFIQFDVLGIDLETKGDLMDAWRMRKPVKLVLSEVKDA